MGCGGRGGGGLGASGAQAHESQALRLGAQLSQFPDPAPLCTLACLALGSREETLTPQRRCSWAKGSWVGQGAGGWHVCVYVWCVCGVRVCVCMLYVCLWFFLLLFL